MNRYLYILILFFSMTLYAQEADSLAVINKKLALDLEQAHKQIDSLETLLNDKQVVALLQERALFQKMTLDRQRRFIYTLTSISFLLVITTLLLVQSSRKSKKANTLLALKSLRTQMNPHFVFNALNSINGFISNQKVMEANKHLTDFASLIRVVMENLQNDFITLSEEIRVLELYLKLEHFRFADTFDYSFNTASFDADTLVVPPMLLQPFIENAIWHGLRNKKGKGQLSVAIEKNESFLLLRVTDNGIGREQSEKLKSSHQKRHQSTGINNTLKRVQLINQGYKSEISIEINDLLSGQSTGTAVLIKIPISLAQKEVI